MFEKIKKKLKESFGGVTVTEMMILVAIIAILASGVGSALHDSLTNGATDTGQFITEKFNEARGE